MRDLRVTVVVEMVVVVNYCTNNSDVTCPFHVFNVRHYLIFQIYIFFNKIYFQKIAVWKCPIFLWCNTELLLR